MLLAYHTFCLQAIVYSFVKASHNEADNVLSIIRAFRVASGQVINFQKSGCFFSKKVHPDKCVSLIRSLNVKKTELGDKYLGIPLFINRNKTESFKHFSDHFNKKNATWKRKHLIYIGWSVMVHQNVEENMYPYIIRWFRV